MKFLKSLLWYIVVLTLSLMYLPGVAQNNLTAAGGDASGNSGSSNYSLGQVFYQSYSNAYGSISEGVQQTFELLNSTSISEADVQLELSVFPNPTVHSIQLVVGPSSARSHSYRLLDAQGRSLQQKAIQSGSHTLNLSAYPAASYFIQVYQEQRLIHTFHILKN